MAFEDDLTEASLDGVEFLYDEIVSEYERAQVLHELPDSRMSHYLEDMGELPAVFSVRAFFIGPNYMADRNRLLEDVLRRGRPMLFVHPYRGPFTVGLLGKIRITETTGAREYAECSFTLVETGPSHPTIVDVTIAQIPYFLNELDDALTTSTTLSTVGTLASVLNDITQGLTEAADVLASVNASITAKIGVVANIGHTIGAFRSEISSLLATPQKLIGTLLGVAVEAMGIVALLPDRRSDDILRDRIDSAAILIAAFIRANAYRSAPSTPNLGTTQSDKEYAAHRAVNLAYSGAVTRAFVTEAVKIDYNSPAQVDAVVDLTLQATDDILSQDPPDSVAIAVLKIRALALRHFAQIGSNLPTVDTIEIHDPLSALTLAHKYGNDPEVFIARNQITDPTNVPPGKPLEILISND